MHFSSFLAPLLLLVGQITIISASPYSFTPEQILNAFKNAVEQVNSATSEISTTTAVTAVTNYNLIVQDTLDASNGFIVNNEFMVGSAVFNKTAENEISVVAVGQLIPSLLTYYTTLQDKAPDFLDPSQKLGIVAAATALSIGAQAFLLAVSELTPNVTIQASIQVQINTVLRAFAFATAAYGDAE